MRRAAFLDRDGVINRKAPEPEYVTTWEEVVILSGVPEAISLLNQSGISVIVVSNQRCVAKGLISIPALEQLHDRMRENLAAQGARIDAIYYCPHEEEPACRCRKPAPGMLLDAARDHNIHLGASWMIGDSVADVEAGRRAGCKTALIGDLETADADLVAGSLLESVRKILTASKTSDLPAGSLVSEIQR